MTRVLTPAQIVTYRANGYLAPIDALSADEVQNYRDGLARSEAHLGGSLMAIDKK